MERGGERETQRRISASEEVETEEKQMLRRVEGGGGGNSVAILANLERIKTDDSTG